MVSQAKQRKVGKSCVWWKLGNVTLALRDLRPPGDAPRRGELGISTATSYLLRSSSLVSRASSVPLRTLCEAAAIFASMRAENMVPAETAAA